MRLHLARPRGVFAGVELLRPIVAARGPSLPPNFDPSNSGRHPAFDDSAGSDLLLARPRVK